MPQNQNGARPQNLSNQQAQNMRPVSSRPPVQNGVRPNPSRPVQNGVGASRPAQNFGQGVPQNSVRPAQNGVRPVQNGARPVARPNQQIPNGARPGVNGTRPVQQQNGIRPNPQMTSRPLSSQRPMQQGVVRNQNSTQPKATVSAQQPQDISLSKLTSPKQDAKIVPKKKFFVLGAVFAAVAIVGVLIGVFMSSAKAYRISFETGPFASVQEVTLQEGEIFTPTEIPSNIVNEDGLTLASFTGWFLDENRTKPYVPSKITKDTKLYAGYSLAMITTSFVVKNFMQENGYIYLGEVESEYYTGKISVNDMASVLASFNSGIYSTANYVYSYDMATSSRSLSSSNLSSENFARLLSTYYTYSGYDVKTTSAGVLTADEISTPSREGAVELVFEPKNISIRYNSNVSSVESYYQNLEDYDYDSNDFVDQTSSVITVPYGENYSVLLYSALRFASPAYHGFMGWSKSANAVAENRSSLMMAGSGLKLNYETLNWGRNLVLYAIWDDDEANVIIYSTLGSNNVLVSESMLLGSSDYIGNIISNYEESLNHSGYALVGFNTKPTLDGYCYNAGDIVMAKKYYYEDGQRKTYPYFDVGNNAIVLYAEYRKVVDEIVVHLEDNSVDDYVDCLSLTFGGVTTKFVYNKNSNTVTKYENDEAVVNLSDVSMNSANWLDFVDLKTLMNISLHLDEKYVYDENLIGVAFDYAQRAIVITNILEGADFILPAIEREHYTSVGGYAIDATAGVNQNVEMNSRYSVDTLHQIINEGRSFIHFVASWIGKDIVIKGLGSGENSTEELFSFETKYGTGINFVVSHLIQGNKTIVTIEVYDVNGNFIKSGSIEQTGYLFRNLIDDNGGEITSSIIAGEEFKYFVFGWEIAEYTVSYNLGNGVFTDRYGNSISGVITSTLEYKSQFYFLKDINKEGYFFDGWSLASSADVVYGLNALDDVQILTDNLKLFAHWTKKYHITFYLDASRETSVVCDAERDDNGVLQYFDLDGSIFDGYNFQYFSTQTTTNNVLFADGGDLFESGDKIFFKDNLASDLSLYAMWFDINFEKAPMYEIEGENPASKKATYGATLTLAKQTSVDFGYVSWAKYYNFVGWAYQENVYSDSVALLQDVVGEEIPSNVKDITFVSAFDYKGVIVRVYQSVDSQVRTQIVVSDISNDEDDVLTLYKGNLPSINGKEVAYLSEYKSGSKEGKKAFFFEEENGQRLYRIIIPKPNESMTSEYYAGKEYFVYNLYANWSFTVYFYDDEIASKISMAYAVPEYTSEVINSAIVVSDLTTISSYQVLTMPQASSLEYTKPHYEFVDWAINDENGAVFENIAEGAEKQIKTDGEAYYATWQGNEYLLNFYTGQTLTASIYERFGNALHLEELYLANGGASQVFDEVWHDLIGFVYSKDNTNINFDLTDLPLFASTLYGGVFDDDDFGAEGVSLFAVLEEKTFDIVVDLNGGEVLSNAVLSSKNTGVGLSVNEEGNLVYTTTYTIARAGITLVDTVFARNGFRHAGYEASALSTIGETNFGYVYSIKGSVDAQIFGGDTIDASWIEQYTLVLSAGDYGTLTQEVYYVQDVEVVGGEKQASIVIAPLDERNSIDSYVHISPDKQIAVCGWSFEEDANALYQYESMDEHIYQSGATITITEEDLLKYSAGSNTITLYALYSANVLFSFEENDVSPISHTVAGEDEAGEGIRFTQSLFVGTVFDLDRLSSYRFNLSSSDGERMSFEGWVKEGEIDVLTYFVLLNEVKLIAKYNRSPYTAH